MELEFKKYCVVDGSPKTVLPSPRHCSKVEKKATKGRLKCGKEKVTLSDDFTEISFHHYRSVSCRSIASRTSGLQGNEVERGSVYQSSHEVRKMKRAGPRYGRRKIELSPSSAIPLPFGIVDSLCSSDEENLLMEPKRTSVRSMKYDLSRTSLTKSQMKSYPNGFLDFTFHPFPEEDFSSSDLLEVSIDSSNQENQSSAYIGRQGIEDLKIRCDLSMSPLKDGNGVRERNCAQNLYKSLSANLTLPHSHVRSEGDSRASSPRTRFSPIRKMFDSRAGSPRTRFSPIRKMFDQFGKSKGQRTPEMDKLSTDGFFEVNRNKTFRKSLLQDFSDSAQCAEYGSLPIKKEQHDSVAAYSPSHLHGLLKLQNKQGMPFFEFSVKSPEDVFVAQTWKAENALNWVYTFHSVQSKQKGNASAWELKESNKISSMVGQMQVSCYLCAKLKGTEAFANSMVTEFVLYDIAHARRNLTAMNNVSRSPDFTTHPKVSNEKTCEVDEVTNELKPRGIPKHASVDGQKELSISCPWPAAELHTNIEIAAIFVEAPFEKRESLKCNSGGRESDQSVPNLLDVSGVEQRKKSDQLSSATVNVVTPCGNHGLPNTDNAGPSSLLNRWRQGGGCDCGGWDMACPLTVLGNPAISSAQDPLMEHQSLLKLFIQGRKEEAPALTLTFTKEGHYAVDFHGQLSTLQAFSICVSILHTTEASIALGQESGKQFLQSSPMRAFIEEEVKYFIDSVTKEEKRKVNMKMEEVLPSFVVNPPFSPIGRV